MFSIPLITLNNYHMKEFIEADEEEKSVMEAVFKKLERHLIN